MSDIYDIVLLFTMLAKTESNVRRNRRRRTTQSNEDIAKNQMLLAISLEKSLLWAWISNKKNIKGASCIIQI